MSLFKIKFHFVFIVSILFYSCNKKRDLYPKELLGGFELLSENHTSIHFNNKIEENDSINQFTFMQIFNGAGVGIGDINNDGLVDIYFCGNQVNDRLYINKGNFKFEDISISSKINLFPGWSNGVTMADVNSDGFLDIYVSRSGRSLGLKEKQNRLFINNQDNTFTESSKKYGLADYGFSTQAVFVDIDNDNDLDMYQVNQLPDPRLFKMKRISKKKYPYYNDQLYENKDGVFRKISKKAGIGGLTHGLNVSASDFNNDGFIDFYITNDYDEPDALYINNGDKTFKNNIHKNLKHISWFSMGSDAADINNNGLTDLITLDMASDDHFRSKTNMGSMSTEQFNALVNDGKHYQYMVNTLQINTSNAQFSDIGSIAGIRGTDWSWAPLFADLDNDGLKDIVITNGIKKDIRNNDYVQRTRNSLKNGSRDYLKIGSTAPSIPMPNNIFKNNGNYNFKNTTSEWKFDTPSFSNGMAYADLDNDGDLDIVTNNVDSPAFVYKNKATGNYLKINFKGPKNNKFGYGTKVILKQNKSTQLAENIVTRGYFSSVAPGVFFGLGKNTSIEEIQIIWPDNKIQILKNITANKTITAIYTEAKFKAKTVIENKTLFSTQNPNKIGINFKHKENNFNDFKEQILLPHKLSQNGPFTTIGDVNNDGIEDFYIGGAAKQSGALYLQNKNGSFTETINQPWEKDKIYEDLGSIFIDVDNDNDLDLYVCSGGNEFPKNSKLLQDRFYLNNGKGQFTKSNDRIPTFYTSTQTIKKVDIDNDGDEDLFIGGRLIPGKYPYPANSHILINENGYFKDKTTLLAPFLNTCGLVTDAVFSDYDNDGDKDLLLVGEWMPITILENNKGIFSDKTKKFDLEKSNGIWWSITANDIDNDGDEDYIIGNLGKNSKFKASKEKPFKIIANDFDNNGTNDVILAKIYKNNYVPVRGKECTSQQMPFVNKKFKNYNSFASSKLQDILPEETFKDAIQYEINSFESIILLNDNGKFTQKKLPIEAQVSTLKSSLILDANKDGIKDILLFGNHFSTEVETVRYDASIGLLMQGDGKGNFETIPSTKSGINLPYDSRDAKLIKTSNNKKMIIISNNNDQPSILTF